MTTPIAGGTNQWAWLEWQGWDGISGIIGALAFAIAIVATVDIWLNVRLERGRFFGIDVDRSYKVVNGLRDVTVEFRAIGPTTMFEVQPFVSGFSPGDTLPDSIPAFVATDGPISATFKLPSDLPLAECRFGATWTTVSRLGPRAHGVRVSLNADRTIEVWKRYVLTRWFRKTEGRWVNGRSREAKPMA